MPTASPYALAIHTTSPDLGLAISNFAGDSRCQVWQLGRDLSTHLHRHLAEFLQPQTWSDLAFMAVAKGPGSFTGTRIGVVTARTLAQQLDIPLFAISTLEAIAWTQRPNHSGSIAVAMPAQRGEVFVAIYQPTTAPVGLITLLPDTVMSLEAWQSTLAARSPDHLFQTRAELGDSVKQVLDLAHLLYQQGKRPHWSETLPFYGQHPVDGVQA